MIGLMSSFKKPFIIYRAGFKVVWALGPTQD